MSVRLMSAVFAAELEPVTIIVKGAARRVMPATLKFVLLALADHASDDGEGAYPSLTLLEKKTGLSRVSVSNALRALRQLGLIERVGISKRGTTNYTLAIPPDGKPSIPPARASKPSLPVVSKPSLPEPSIKPSNTTTTAAAAVQAYEREIGQLTPIIRDAIQDALTEYPPEWIPAAIQEAARANVRRWNYAESILRRWKVEGFRAVKTKGTPNGTTQRRSSRGNAPVLGGGDGQQKPASQYDALFTAAD